MKLCFPVDKVEDLDSIVSDQFGLANYFVVVDTDTMAIESVKNEDHAGTNSISNSLKMLVTQIDALILKTVNNESIYMLKEVGLELYQAVEKSIRDNVNQYINKTLPEHVDHHHKLDDEGFFAH